MLPNKIIATVGTSLLSNLQNLESRQNLSDDYKELSTHYKAQEWSQVARILASIDSNERVCGAEINSITSLFEKNFVSRPLSKIYFCVSDTDEGKVAGEILRFYYQKQKNVTEQVEICPIEGLQDDNPNVFRTIGLRQLARKIGEIVRESGDSSLVALNATGGYKAQIAIAVLIGQTLGINVYYKHEKFNEIIEFPPMPIAFDYDLIGKNANVLKKLELGEYLELDESSINPSLRVLLEEVEGDDNKRLCALAPIGQIYLEGYRLKHPPEISLPQPAENKRFPTFGNDHHYPKSFKDFVEKVWNENDFVKTCHTIPYSGQSSIRDREFYVDNEGRIVGEYKNKDFGARFVVSTTATTSSHKAAVAMSLNEKYK
jgi:putative CRISPR-associated protein (TIGR02619 family)